MRLKHPILGVFLQAMQDSFNKESLAPLLLMRLGISYTEFTNVNLRWVSQVIEVHEYFDFLNETERLVAVLRDARPSVPEFSLAADSLGFTTVATADLEVLIRNAVSPYQDVDQFRARLAAIEAATCQIETGAAIGTGTLIAPDLVITNRHVVASQIDAGGKLSTSAICRFDFKTNGTGYTTPAINVAAIRLLASSPHALQDIVVGAMASDPGALDYAILQLDRPFAEEPVAPGGERRGHVDVSATPQATPNAGVLILQHPGGKPMKVDLGSILDVGVTRFRHSVNTEPGSSGAPVFDAALKLVGIHHAGHNGGPGPGLTYNQGIPMGAIMVDARLKGVVI